MPGDHPRDLRAVPSEDELVWRRLVVVIGASRQHAAALQAERESLREELGRFELTYQHHTGHLLLELNRLRLACDEYRHRIALLRERPTAEPDQIESDVTTVFHDRYHHLADEEREATVWEHEHAAEQASPDLSEDDLAEVHRAYRELARRHHPDLVSDPAERERREAQMARINAAYHERDLDALRTLLTLSSTDEMPAGRSWRERRAWAEAEVHRLDQVVSTIADEIATLRGSAIHALLERYRRDPKVLTELGEQITGQIDVSRTTLEGLRERIETMRRTAEDNPEHDDGQPP